MKVKRRRKSKLQVHGSWGGGALCGFSENTPGTWPPGHKWAHPIRDGTRITCEACKPKAARLREEHLEAEKAKRRQKRQKAFAAT